MRNLVVVLLTTVTLVAGCATTSQSHKDREQLKREIIEELRAEQEATLQPAQESQPAQEPLQPAQEVPQPAQQVQRPVIQVIAVPTGSVEGRMLFGGEPLAGCRVRLVLVEVRRGLFGTSYAQTSHLETVTDDAGEYRFLGVPTGPYKLKWVAPGGDSWIRFLSTEPDLMVEVGATVRFRDIESAQRVLGN